MSVSIDHHVGRYGVTPQDLGGLLARERPDAPDQALERLPIDELHREEVPALEVSGVMHPGHVGRDASRERRTSDRKRERFPSRAARWAGRSFRAIGWPRTSSAAS
ncbi:MAG: hypothetical protein ACPGPE_17625, partial [Planctomycetota bacterium]